MRDGKHTEFTEDNRIRNSIYMQGELLGLGTYVSPNEAFFNFGLMKQTPNLTNESLFEEAEQLVIGRWLLEGMSQE